MSTSISQELHRAEGLVFRVAREADGEAVTRLLANSFTHEPMSRVLGLTEQEMTGFVASFIPECMTNELSVLAVPEDEPSRIIGAFINRDFKAPLPPGMPEDFPRFAPIVDALVNVDTQYEQKRPDLRLGQAVDLWMVGVALGSAFARRGVARSLFKLSTELARQRGFQRCVTECTGYYSQRGALASGYEEMASVVYKDFLFEGRPVFASIPAPHARLVLFERTL